MAVQTEGQKRTDKEPRCGRKGWSVVCTMSVDDRIWDLKDYMYRV